MAAGSETVTDLREDIARFPTRPGCYLMKDKDGVVIYVGKATNLRNRVRSYFNGHDGRYSVRFLMQRVQTIEFALAQDEREALLLENSLIKKYRPRYNVRLRDDKNYLSVKFNLKHKWPRMTLVRRAKNDGSRYFGPYGSAQILRQTVEYLGQVFPLRTCTDRELKSRSRPCLQYQIKRCCAPCVDYVTPEAYQDICRQVVMVLEGKDQELQSEIRGQMTEAAQALDFEKAAQLRDRLAGLEGMGQKQQVISHNQEDRDILGFHREGDEVVVAILPIRGGRMQDNRTFHFKGQSGMNHEILTSFINMFYEAERFIPKEILHTIPLPDVKALESLLQERHPQGRRIHIRAPQRGDKTRLVKLAQQTAELYLAKEMNEARRADKALGELQKILRLPKMPSTLECFDISNIQGRHPVASKVRFKDASPEKDGYRRYKIKTLEEKPNDYGMMREVLTRRFKRSLEEGGAPDVLVVDGGKGQLNVAIAVLQELGLSKQPVIGFAKPDDEGARGGNPITIDKIFLPGRKNPVVLSAHSPCLKMLQYLRDESHRFAITFHRQLRTKNTMRSELADIPGVGPKRQKLLLKAFGSVKGLRAATLSEIQGVEGIGEALARDIFVGLHGVGAL